MARVATSKWGCEMKKVILLAALIIMLFAIAGCQTTQPRIVTKVEYVRVEIPPQLLSCMPEPQARAAWKTQRQVALYLIKLSEAGEDCRVKLAAVKAWAGIR